MTDDATPQPQPESDEPMTATPFDEADDLDDVPAVAGGTDDGEPAQGVGEADAH